MRTRSGWWIGIAAVAALSFIALRSAKADRYDDVRAMIRRELRDKPIPSIAVAVVHHGKIEWEEAFGWADRETKRLATTNTPYSLASISKPLTATGLMTLVAAGKIDLDRPINDYLGAAKLNARAGNAADATVRRVANHSSGLPLHHQFFYADEPYRRPAMDETILRYGNLVTAPGERYQYSNLGYGVLDYVISRVSGMSYAEFMRREVFEPLGMMHSSVDIAPGLASLAATRYGADGKPIPFYDFDHPGGSAIFASVHDMALFALFHLQNPLPQQKPILTPEQIGQMHRPTQSSGRQAGYGIGFATSTIAGGYQVVSHSGGMGGVSTALRMFPEEKLAIVVLSNSRTLFTGRVVEAIQRTKLKWKPSPATPPPTRKFTPSADLVGVWSGSIHTHAGERAFTLWIRPSGEIHTQIATQPKVALKDPYFEGGYVMGTAAAEVDTDDTRRNHSHVQLSLKLRGEVLNGAVTAFGRSEPRIGNGLSHWAELRRQTHGEPAGGATN